MYCLLNPESARTERTGRSSDFLKPDSFPKVCPSVELLFVRLCKQDYSSGYCSGFSPDSLFIHTAGRHGMNTCYVCKGNVFADYIKLQNVFILSLIRVHVVNIFCSGIYVCGLDLLVCDVHFILLSVKMIKM